MEVLEITTPPAVEPVTLAEAKAFLRLEITNDDDLVTELISAARIHCETVLRQCLITTQFRWSLDQFPWGGGYWNRAIRQMGPSPYWLPANTGILHLPKAPLQSVQSVGYTDYNGNVDVIDPSLYKVATVTPAAGGQVAGTGRIQPRYGKTWPVARPEIESIAIAFTAGYGDDGTKVPSNVKVAMKMMITHWYETRDVTITGTIISRVPDAVDALLAGSDHGGYA